MRRVAFALLVIVSLIATGLAALRFVVAAAPADRSPVGKQISGFELHDYLGAAHKLDEWAGKKAIVVVFLGHECPIAKLLGPRLAELSRAMKTRELPSSASTLTRKIRCPTSHIMPANIRSRFRS